MTLREKLIATAYTGITFIDGKQMGEFYEFLDKELGIKCVDIQLSDKSLWKEIHNKVQPLFIEMVQV